MYKFECMKDDSRSDDVLSRHGIDGVKAHGTEDVPSAHLTTVFVLKKAIQRFATMTGVTVNVLL